MQHAPVQSQPVDPRPSPIQRETIHDLRNLFGIVSSAKHLLEGQPAKVRRLALLQAIEAAAIRGGELTTSLLTPTKSPGVTARLDLNDRIMALDPKRWPACGDARTGMASMVPASAASRPSRVPRTPNFIFAAVPDAAPWCL